jgi:hypothetical protein
VSDLVHLGELVAGAGEADFQALGLAEPVICPGFGDAGGQVVADLVQTGVLGGVSVLHAKSAFEFQEAYS